MRILKRFCIACVKGYRWLISPIFFSFGVQCRFIPPCSEFALEALERHGAAKGSLLAFNRLLRCQPFCRGGHDPVPRGTHEKMGIYHG